MSPRPLRQSVVAKPVPSLPTRRAGWSVSSRVPPTATRPSAADPIVEPMQGEGVQVTGTVVDALGGPIAGASLSVLGAGTDPRVSVLSDSAGVFRLMLRPGKQRIVARAEGYSEQQLPVSAPSVGLVFVLAAGASIGGRVIAKGSHTPVAGINVSVRSADGQLTAARVARTHDDGTFTVSDLPPGAYSLRAISERWRSDEQRVALGLAEVTQTIELTAHPARQLQGTVLVSGSPCPTGWVELRGASRASAAINDGRVVLDGITPGHYEISLDCEGALAQTLPIDIDLTDAVSVWNLEPGLQLSGMALTAAGAPAAGVVIEVNPSDENPDRADARCVADERGEFSCRGLVAGDYDCSIGLGVPARSDSVRVRVSDGEAPRVTLQLHAEASIRVRIRSPERFDLGALTLLAKRHDGKIVPAELQGDEMVFSPLALGSYEVALASGAPGSSQIVQLTREGQVELVSLALPAPHTLSGRVVDNLGQGVPDVWVRASNSGVFGGLVTPVLTAAAGDFNLAGLAPGAYLVEASSGEGEGELDGVASDSRDARVLLRKRGLPADP
jgi:hypothetical protein